MTTVVEIVNFIDSHSSLVYMLFKFLLPEIDCEYGDLLLHSNVRWLGWGKVFTRFVCCPEAIKVFLHEKETFSWTV